MSRSPFRAAVRCGVAVLALALALPLTAQETAWMLVNPVGQPLGSSFSPSPDYRFQSNGGTPVVRRANVGNFYFVDLPGIVDDGVVHACAYGGNHTVGALIWARTATQTTLLVSTFDAAGQAVNDKQFVVYFRSGGEPDQRTAWVRHQPPTQLTPAQTDGWNGNRAQPSVNAVATGVFDVLLPGLGASVSGEFGNLQVSTASFFRGRIASWSTTGGVLAVRVAFVDQNGQPVDTLFNLSYSERAGPIDPEVGSGAHVRGDQPTAAFYEPLPAYTDSNGPYGVRNAESIERQSAGVYRVRLPNVASASSVVAIATLESGNAGHAAIRNWVSDGHGGTIVTVETYDASGAAVDRRFQLLYLTNHPTEYTAWAWVTPAFFPGPSFTPDSRWQYTSSGNPITVVRNVVPGLYSVQIPDVPLRGHEVQVSAYAGDHTAEINGFTTGANHVSVSVQLRDPAGNLAVDHPFVIRYGFGGRRGAKKAYLWAHDPVAASYTPNTDWSWNGDRPDPQVTRSAPGAYQVRLPGLAPTGSERGHVQVSTWSGGFHHTRVQNWFTSGADLLVNVRCHGATGALVDGGFMLSYHETAAAAMPPGIGSGAHVWADNPTAASYTPNALYTESNGTLGPANAEIVRRTAVGRYEVDLPNVAPSESSMAIVSAHGTAPTHACVNGWLPRAAGGTTVRVETYTAAGTSTDATFTLHYLTNRPADGWPASNLTVGSGCHGVMLGAPVRPILGSDWSLELTGLPAGTILGFVQLGLANPAQPLGPQAPGCTSYTSGDATFFVFPPVQNPVYSLAIPTGAVGLSLLGLPIHAQGGAFAPGLNALSIALSPGLIGTVGDV